MTLNANYEFQKNVIFWRSYSAVYKNVWNQLLNLGLSNKYIGLMVYNVQSNWPLQTKGSQFEAEQKSLFHIRARNPLFYIRPRVQSNVTFTPHNKCNLKC
jgi:hypothetical protein